MNRNVPRLQQENMFDNIDIDDLPAGMRALFERMQRQRRQNYVWTIDDQRTLNMAINNLTRRNGTVHPERDELGNLLVLPPASRLISFHNELLRRYEYAMNEIYRLRADGVVINEDDEPTLSVIRLPNDDLDRGVIAVRTEEALHDIGDFLRVKRPTANEIAARKSFPNKIRARFGNHYNNQTKERLEVNTAHELYAITLAHTDLAEGGDPNMLAISANGARKMKYKSDMNQTEIARLNSFYARL